MTEEWKHAILFAATLLCARKMIEIMDSDKPNFAKQFFVDKAIDEATFILERIDKRWPLAGPSRSWAKDCLDVALSSA
jgi:hypothetical protein